MMSEAFSERIMNVLLFLIRPVVLAPSSYTGTHYLYPLAPYVVGQSGQAVVP